jgi:ribonuclease D
VRREIGLAGVKLAPLAGAHDLAGISDRGGPVEALAERVAHESAWHRVVAAYSRVYVLEELAPLRDGHAALQDSQRGALVQSTRVNDLAILARRASDRSEGSSPRSI